jgi:hypothetical protein
MVVRLRKFITLFAVLNKKVKSNDFTMIKLHIGKLIREKMDAGFISIFRLFIGNLFRYLQC